MYQGKYSMPVGSPVSDDGRGLKLCAAAGLCRRARGSPVSDDGRGLKQDLFAYHDAQRTGSPVSDDGRGLKRPARNRPRPAMPVRPSVMTGVD